VSREGEMEERDGGSEKAKLNKNKTGCLTVFPQREGHWRDTHTHTHTPTHTYTHTHANTHVSRSFSMYPMQTHQRSYFVGTHS